MFSKPKYSAVAKIYLNDISLLVGINSNSNTATSNIPNRLKFCSIKRGTLLATFNKSGSVTIGTTPTSAGIPVNEGFKEAISPVDKTNPDSNPRFELVPSKKPI